MLSELIAKLRQIDPELSAEDVADALWLAAHMGPLLEEPASELTPSSDSNAVPPNKDDTTVVIPTPTVPPSTNSNMYLRSEVERKKEGRQLPTSPLRSPTVPALPHSLKLARSLRPFSALVPDTKRKALDEEATADRIAESDVWIPVLNHLMTHWFDVALVVDIGASMTIWQQTIADLYLLLACHGAFRDVRRWELDTNDQDKVHLYAGTGGDGQRQARDARELIDTSKRRLILVLTDCVSPAWHSGRVAEVLADWGQYNVVTLVQVLPQILWLRTALHKENPIRLRTSTPGCVNTQFSFQSTSFWHDEDIPHQPVPLPIVTLEPEALLAWAQVVARAEDRWIPGYLLATPAEKQAEIDGQELFVEETPAAPPSALERVQYFRATASSAARRLAGLLTMVPISMPVVRLVQQTMFLEPRQVEVAEIFLSGLLQVVSSGDGNSEEAQYDFVEGVREILLDTVPINEGVRVLREISDFIEKKYNQVLDFAALIANPGASEGITINEKSRPFASVAAQALRRFGEPYRSLAYRLEEVIIVPPDEPLPVPEPTKELVESVSVTSTQVEVLPQPVPSNEPPFLDEIAVFHSQPVIEERKGLIVKSVCPSCFEEVQHGDCDIMSGITPGKVLKEAPKNRIERRLARLDPERLDNPRYRPEKARFKCPECGYLLPANVERVPGKPLAIVGNVYAGKSHYIAALLEQLKTEWIDKSQGAAQLTCLTPEVEEKYIKDYLDLLFKNKQIIKPSQLPKVPAEPLIYELTTNFQSGQTPRSVNLIIYDVLGEAFETKRLVRLAGFVFDAGAFIFVTDPVMITSIFRQLPSRLQKELEELRLIDVRRAGQVVTDTIDLFERYHGYSEGASLKTIPIAVMLSKADLLKYLKPPVSYTFMTKSFYRSSLDLKNAEIIDQEVRDCLELHGQRDIEVATSRLKRVKFFATSATGEPPDATGRFKSVKPLRCLDPLLWILYEFGLIGAHP